MKYKKLWILALCAFLSLAVLSGCTKPPEDTSTAGDISAEDFLQQGGSIQEDAGSDTDIGSDIGAFRPVDCGVRPLALYEYPFIGLTIRLSQTMLDQMDTRDVFVMSDEDYTEDLSIKYALLRFSAPAQEEKAREVMSIDILSWEAALPKIGALGIYQKGMADELDTLTSCDTHTKLGESTDGQYEYYLSTNSSGDPSLVDELGNTEITISELHPLDLNFGYTAFSTDRLDDVSNVGEFTTQDVFGNTCTQDIFGEYDLTLVNVFATWCSPCVEEIPDLEALRKAFQEKGINLGVVAIPLDTVTATGIDESALEQAQILHQRSGAQFPFLLPDSGNMNGRLTGIEGFPESFFVDKSGNIVSEPYLNARSLSQWAEVVEQELLALKGGSQ